MKYREFLHLIDDAAVLAAIRGAEERTSGEIRVFVCHLPTADPQEAARQRFHELKMDRTALRNGVLIFVAPLSRNFAVIGDAGIHERCGDVFWQSLAAELEAGFRAGDFTAALTTAIRHAGDLLACHFPVPAENRNELPDDIVRSGGE